MVEWSWIDSLLGNSSLTRKAATTHRHSLWHSDDDGSQRVPPTKHNWPQLECKVHKESNPLYIVQSFSLLFDRCASFVKGRCVYVCFVDEKCKAFGHCCSALQKGECQWMDSVSFVCLVVVARSLRNNCWNEICKTDRFLTLCFLLEIATVPIHPTMMEEVLLAMSIALHTLFFFDRDYV